MCYHGQGKLGGECMENLHMGHRDRMRKRFLAEGLENFAPHEVLEFLLFNTIPRGDTNPIAHRLLTHFGSLSAVFDAKYEDLLKVEGVGPKSAMLICSVQGLSKVYLSDQSKKKPIIKTTEDMAKYLRPRFLGANSELFYIVCLDDKRSVLQCQLLKEGQVDSVRVDMRHVVDIILRSPTTAVVLAHNHPAQFALPSSDDITQTKRIMDILKTLNIKVIDHLVFSKSDYVSMRDSGYFVGIDY